MNLSVNKFGKSVATLWTISLWIVFFDLQCSTPAQETAKHRAKFDWRPLSDVGAVTKPRRETRWNLLGCPKLANRSQPLVGQVRHIVHEDMEEICPFNKFFRPSIHTLVAKIQPNKAVRWWVDGYFCIIFASSISNEPRVAHFRPAF